MMNDRDAVRRALLLAIEWERSLIDCLNEKHADQRAQADQCRQNIAAFERVLDRRYNGARLPQPDGGEPITLSQVFALPK